jgi:hypothetical protein
MPVSRPRKRGVLHDSASYCDAKVANREIRVWHFVIESAIE